MTPEHLDEAVAEEMFLDQSATAAADRAGFEGALDQLDQFLADKTLVRRRTRDERAKRLAIAERDRDQALGADKRPKAVARVGALEADIADLDARLAQLPAREFDTYRRWHEDAHHRRFQRPAIGMGLSSMHVSRPDRRDRLLLLSALAIAVLSLLGAAGERIGYDHWLKANTVKRRTHSLFRQGLMLYHHLPNWPEDRIRPLMETFGSMLMEQRVYREVFGVI